MTTESNPIPNQKTKTFQQRGTSDAVYGLGMLGAWFYYLTHATSIWVGLLRIIKGIFWPAVLVYEVFKYLGL